MAIKKQEFYEGAALHVLARAGAITSLRYESPFFVVNEALSTLFKYSTRTRSPWGFTFTSAEQTLLQQRSRDHRTVVALICGDDGVAAFGYEAYSTIGGFRSSALHIACYRRHGEHYAISGPDGVMSAKVSPSNWRRILES